MTYPKYRTAFLVLLVLLALQAPARAQTTRHVLVDAGHGGHDLGATSGGLEEKRVALEFARQLEKALILRGFRVTMTREKDVFIPLDDRAREAEERGADFFVSVHANAAESSSLRGFEVYYFSPEEDRSAVIAGRAQRPPPSPEKAKFESPSPAVMAAYWELRLTATKDESKLASGYLEKSVETSIYTAARRQRPAGFRVLKWTGCPAVLVETGYLTNRDDRRLLRSPIYRKKLAGALAQGLAWYRDANEAKAKI